VLELLNSLAKGELATDDLRVYFLKKDREKTIVESQGVNSKGQIEGGLKSFYDTELEQVREFVHAREG
jgi:predicted ATPase